MTEFLIEAWRQQQPSFIVMPDDEPPPYTELPENGNISIEQGVGVSSIRQWDVQTNRPASTASGTSGNSSRHSSVGSGRSSTASKPSSADSRPSTLAPPKPSRPSSTHSASSSRRHSSSSSRPSSTSGPPPGPPPGRYGPPPGPPPSHYSHSNQQAPPSGKWGPPGPGNWGPAPPGPLPGPPLPQKTYLRYPRGFYCRKCGNTGTKIKKGTSCQDCWERFGVSGSQVQYVPSNVQPIFPVPPRIVQPGDPSIGGVLCGRCRGRGNVSDFFSGSVCPICHGVGRVF